MGLEPIRVELTDFLKLELLRDEEERLTTELAGVEKQIREWLIVAAERGYLLSLSQYYAHTPEQDAAGAVAQLEARRALVADALEAVRANHKQLEETLGSAAQGRAPRSAAARRPAAPGPAGKRSRFDSFEDFRQTQDQAAGNSQPQG